MLRKIKSIILSFIYKGDKYYCPVCDGHFRTFLSFGIQKRKNACCPRCRSLERHRLLWLYLKNKTNLFNDDLKLLHIAPELVLKNKFKKMNNIKYYSADLHNTNAMVKTDLTSICFKVNSFDAILCTHVLEHINDDKKAMQELHRVLNTSGWAILQVPIDKNRKETFEDFSIAEPEEREKHFGQKDHVRCYGLDYKDRLTSTGFSVKLDNYVMQLSGDIRKKYSLDEKEDIYFCTK